jgi:hypothetical protein
MFAPCISLPRIAFLVTCLAILGLGSGTVAVARGVAFGQVEADPSIINLTANESFFSERRPFFLEGNDIFRFGNTKTYSRFGNPITFYSRRIGRTPQGSPGRAGLGAQFTDQPDHTTIASAVKLSGKTDSGWSIGSLNAFTLRENARYLDEAVAEGLITIEAVKVLRYRHNPEKRRS